METDQLKNNIAVIVAVIWRQRRLGPRKILKIIGIFVAQIRQGTHAMASRDSHIQAAVRALPDVSLALVKHKAGSPDCAWVVYPE